MILSGQQDNIVVVGLLFGSTVAPTSLLALRMVPLDCLAFLFDRARLRAEGDNVEEATSAAHS